jgi:hypothetical protein
MEVAVMVGGGRVAVDGIPVFVSVITGWMVGEEVISRVVGATALVWVGEDRLATGDGLERLQAEKKDPAARR